MNEINELFSFSNSSIGCSTIFKLKQWTSLVRHHKSFDNSRQENNLHRLFYDKESFWAKYVAMGWWTNVCMSYFLMEKQSFCQSLGIVLKLFGNTIFPGSVPGSQLKSLTYSIMSHSMTYLHIFVVFAPFFYSLSLK